MTIVLTRPEGENEGLAKRLSEIEDVLVLPLIKLSAKPMNPQLKQTAMDLDLYDEIIFVSKSAVRFSMPQLERYWPQWPLKLRWLAVGSGTANMLKDYEVPVTFPETAGSEGLLSMSELQDVAGHRVLISRGSGGRELLATTLARRGATVDYYESYERGAQSQSELFNIPDGSILVATSAEIMNSAHEQLKGRHSEMTMIVPSDRIESLAETLGFRRVRNAHGASEQALYDAVVNELKK